MLGFLNRGCWKDNGKEEVSCNFWCGLGRWAVWVWGHLGETVPATGSGCSFSVILQPWPDNAHSAAHFTWNLELCAACMQLRGPRESQNRSSFLLHSLPHSLRSEGLAGAQIPTAHSCHQCLLTCSLLTLWKVACHLPSNSRPILAWPDYQTSPLSSGWTTPSPTNLTLFQISFIGYCQSWSTI